MADAEPPLTVALDPMVSVFVSTEMVPELKLSVSLTMGEFASDRPPPPVIVRVENVVAPFPLTV